VLCKRCCCGYVVETTIALPLMAPDAATDLADVLAFFMHACMMTMATVNLDDQLPAANLVLTPALTASSLRAFKAIAAKG